MILTFTSVQNADLSMAFEERRLARSRWVFPEVAFVHNKDMISAEDIAGYSLMVPADHVARSQEALEASTTSAAKKFVEGASQYLIYIHPHETTNLSVAIFSSYF